MIKKFLFIFFVLLIFSTCFCTKKDTIIPKQEPLQKSVSTEKKVLHFGFIPSVSIPKTRKKYSKLINYLETQVNIKIKFKYKLSYEEIAGALSDDIDFAAMGAYSYLLAEKLYDVRPIVRTIRNGKDYYYSTIIVRKDSNINSIKDLKNKKIAFADKYSTAGFLYPACKLIKSGFKFKNDIEYQFLKNYSFIVKKIFNGNVDAGCTFEGAEKYLPESQRQELKILYKSSKIPSDPIIAGKKLFEDPELLRKIKQAFLKLNPDEHLTILTNLGGGIEGYTEASKKDYNKPRKKIKIIKKVFN